MSAKAILVFCAQALLIQTALSQCTSRAAIDATGIGASYGWADSALAPGFAYNGLAAPFAYDGFAGPYGYNGLFATPSAFEGFAAPFGGAVGPCACDGLTGWTGRGLGYDGLYPAIASAIEITPTTGGTLTVTSASAIPPTGISVISENAYDGVLAVAGEVPFVGTTGMEGVLPTAGAGAVNHACGNGINAMISENTAFAPGYAGAAIAPAAAIAPVAAIAPGAFGPGFAFSNSWAPAAGYNGCGYGYAY